MFKLQKMILCFLLSSTVCIQAVSYSTPEANLVNAFVKSMSLSTSKAIITSLLAFGYGIYIGYDYMETEDETKRKIVNNLKNNLPLEGKPAGFPWVPVTVGAGIAGIIKLVSSVDDTSSTNTQDFIQQAAAIPLAIGTITAITLGVGLGWNAMAKLCATIKQKFSAEQQVKA